MDHITVVSGLPRSGTSMMMQILEAGGFPLLTDYLRTPDSSNPKGYYEFEEVKQLRAGNTQWVEKAKGRAVKIISPLLEFLPSQYLYRVIFMQRYVEEVLASQKVMLLQQKEEADTLSDAQLAVLYAKHLMQVQSWLSKQTNMNVLYVSYNEMLREPESSLPRINHLLEGGLDLERMRGVIDRKLYRNRNGSQT